MKLFALISALLALAAGSTVRFEADGVRIGDTLVQGKVMELKGAGAAALLASGSSVEPLAGALDIELAPGRALAVEPGVRAERADKGCRLLSPAGRKIRFEAGDRVILLDGPVTVMADEAGWTVGAERIEPVALRAGVQAQDDADANLQKMRQSSQRMRDAARSGRMVRVFGSGDPVVGTEAADSHTVRALGSVSPAGF